MLLEGLELKKSPFVIGITGHRQLPPEQLHALTVEIQAFYEEKKAQHNVKNITVLSPLAEGADMLCAKLALDADLRLVVPLPMNALEYRKDFSESAAAMFDCLLSRADQVFVVSPEEPVPAGHTRGFYYRQAGLYIAKHSDVLLAVWDLQERNSSDGAGTWETIKLAQGFDRQIHRVTLSRDTHDDLSKEHAHYSKPCSSSRPIQISKVPPL